jgi:hypothetical protein
MGYWRSGYAKEVLAKDGSKYYKVIYEFEDGYVMHSNAVEVCNEHGCKLVPACWTGTISARATLEIKEITEEEAETLMYELEPLEEVENLYDYIRGVLEYDIEQLEETVNRYVTDEQQAPNE